MIYNCDSKYTEREDTEGFYIFKKPTKAAYKRLCRDKGYGEYIGSASRVSGTGRNDHSFSLHFDDCPGSCALLKFKNSACTHCYARKEHQGNSHYWTQLKWRNNKKLLEENFFVASIVYRIPQNCKVFRWFSCGDLQDFHCLRKICMAADIRSDVQFWLPTRQYKIVEQVKQKYGDFPNNLHIRLSRNFLNQKRRINKDFRESVVVDYTKFPGILNKTKTEAEKILTEFFNEPTTLCSVSAEAGRVGCQGCIDCLKDIPLIAYYLDDAKM
jgi:hypothetical protein